MTTERSIKVHLDAITSSYKSKMREAGQVARDFGNEATRVGRQWEQAGSKISQVGGKLSTHLTLPLAAAGFQAGRLALEFETSLTRIHTLVGLPRAEIDKLRKSVLQLSHDTAKSPDELAQALYFVTSAGFSGAEAMEVVTASAKAAAAGLGETGVIADAITSVMGAYGRGNISAAKATDIMVAAIRLGKNEASELAPILGRVVPIAAEMGVEFDQVAGAIAAMSLKGLDADEAATALRGLFGTLLKPSAEARDALGSVGISVEDLRGAVRQDLLGGLTLLGDGLQRTGTISTASAKELRGVEAAQTRLAEALKRHGRNSNQAQLATLALQDAQEKLAGASEGSGDALDRLGVVIPNIRALTGFLNLASNGGAELRTVLDGTANSAGDADKAFRETSETVEFKFKQAVTDINKELLEAGLQLLPRFVEVLNNIDPGTIERLGDTVVDFATTGIGLLEKLLDLWDRFPDGVQDFIAKMIVLGAIAGPVMKILGGGVSVGGGAARAAGWALGSGGAAAGAGGAAGAGASAVTSGIGYSGVGAGSGLTGSGLAGAAGVVGGVALAAGAGVAIGLAAEKWIVRPWLKGREAIHDAQEAVDGMAGQLERRLGPAGEQAGDRLKEAFDEARASGHLSADAVERIWGSWTQLQHAAEAGVDIGPFVTALLSGQLEVDEVKRRLVEVTTTRWEANLRVNVLANVPPEVRGLVGMFTGQNFDPRGSGTGGSTAWEHSVTGKPLGPDPLDEMLTRAPHRATGGPAYAGRLYRINESGDEYFAPAVDGTVYPAGFDRQRWEEDNALGGYVLDGSILDPGALATSLARADALREGRMPGYSQVVASGGGGGGGGGAMSTAAIVDELAGLREDVRSLQLDHGHTIQMDTRQVARALGDHQAARR